MKRTVKITASCNGTISTGQWENEKPFYGVEEVIEDCNLSDKGISDRQKELSRLCYSQFKAQANLSYTEKIEKQYQNIRFYNNDGVRVPSVTSILGWDKDFHIPEDELNQFGCRGTLIHKQVEIFLTTGEWKSPQDIEECAFEYKSVAEGSLGLDFEDVNFRAFFTDYPFKTLEVEKSIVNKEHEYGGRLDILCVIEPENKGKWEKIEGVKFDEPTILDIKTSTNLNDTNGLTQQSAYSKAIDVKQIGLIHLTKSNKCGFAKPIITTNIERYWNLFLNKRNEFRRRYGV